MRKRGRILVVDDEPVILELFREYLVEQGLEVITALSGAEALERLATDKPDLIFLDMRMPGMDGIEALKRIRAANLRIPVLMISANDDLAAAKQAIALGAFDYTLKPVDFNYLGRALDKMLATAQPVVEHGFGGIEPVASAQGLLYDLALEVFRATRTFPPTSRESLGVAIEHAALSLVQRAGDKPENVRALNQVRSLLRFAKDLGDLADETHRMLESHIARARRSVGLD
jgi:CheY-like chemotaxis protein